MNKFMLKKSFLYISVILVLLIGGCIKETYNMRMLSKQAHLSPTLAISAVKGDFSFSDAVKTSDTVVFDEDKLVILVFKKDSVVDLKLSDFSKATIQKTAKIDSNFYDLDLGDVLDNISGTIKFFTPSIKFNYTNSFSDPLEISLNVTAEGDTSTVPLKLAPFTLSKPNLPVQQEITASYVIDKSNSNLPDLISLPPKTINYSGTALMTSTVKDNGNEIYAIGANRMTGSLEIDVPMDLSLNNLQFKDTVNNFIKSDDEDNPLDPSDFQLLRINVSAKNGFPLGASLEMSLYDSSTKTIKSTVDATGLFNPAPVDDNGKANGVTETSTSIEFTSAFFSNVNTADKIIFTLTLNTTGSVPQEVKIYSDYRFNFTAALVVKPDINFN
jgi:hypothetical protein